VDVQKVEPRDVALGVDVVGTLAPKFEAAVNSEVPGRISKIYVTQWVPVTEGQPLAEVDSRELETSMGRARAAVEGARAQEMAAQSQAASARGQEYVARSQLAVAKSQEEAAKAALLGTKVDFDRAQREYERLQKLKENGLATQQSVDEGRTAHDAAEARVSAAHAQIRAASAQVEAAQAQVHAAGAQASSAEAQGAAASAQLKAAKEDVHQLETRLSKAVIRAPLSGVVSERTANVGDLIGDKPIFHIVDNSMLNLTVTIPTQSFSTVKVGQPLTFTTDALPGETFTGQVMYINPSADPSDRSVRVTAEVRNLPQKLKGGFFVKGRIVTGDRKGVLFVPRSALATWDMANGRAEIFVVSGTVVKKRSVRTGAVESDLVEVVSGLSPGDTLVTRGGFNLRDGDAVVVSSGKGA
jgi:RND family efflux transporter MFP subunit